MPLTKVLFGAQLGAGANTETTFFEEVKLLEVPQEVLDAGEEAVKEYLQTDWEYWVDYHTSSIIELID